MSYSNDPYDLDYPLLFFDAQKEDAWTLNDACTGIFISGATGAGKSSGPGRNIAKAFLTAGYGFLVLTAKSDERANFVKYARECGRENDLIIFSEENQFRFNPIDFELKRTGRGGGQIRNVVNLLMTLYKLGAGNTNNNQRNEDQFWQAAVKRLITRVITLIRLAGEELNIDNMYAIITSALQHPSDWHDDHFIADSYCVRCLELAHENDGESPEYQLAYQYWSKEYPSLDEKTRSIIRESLLGILDPLMSGILRELFMTSTNVSPLATHEGKIIIMDLPVQQYLELGLYAQSIMKYCWQLSAEFRDTKESPIPIVLWEDEAQLFITEYDFLFQSTARSSKVCTVLLSQNISNFYAAMKGSHPKEQVDSLLGNLNTKCFLANSDSVTNNWAADLIGKEFQLIASYQTQLSDSGSSATGANQLHHLVQPTQFTKLKTGGKRNHYIVQSIIVVTGRIWSNGKTFLEQEFDQRA